MPVIMIMRWEGFTADQYQALRKELNLESDPPAGGMLHLAAFDARGARITDAWETGELFNEFVERRLMPAVAKLGIAGRPEVEIYPAESIYAPAYTKNP